MMKERRKRGSVLSVAALSLLLFAGVAHASGASAAAENPAYQADDIREVHLSQADMTFLPYYQARPEDREALAKVADLLNRVIAKGKAVPTSAESGEDLFFREEMTISMQDGSGATLFVAGPDTLACDRKDSPRIEWKDADAYADYVSMEVQPERTKLDRNSVAVGDELRVSGSDVDLEQGTFYLFVDDGSLFYSVHSDREGLDYPSKKAILVGQGEFRYGRYDMTFRMPATGRTWDGKTVPVPTGKVSLVADFGWKSSSPTLEIKPASPALLAVNGVPAADEAARPIAVDGRVLVPLRAAASLLGQRVDWDAQGKNVLIRTAASQATAAEPGRAGIWIDGAEASSDVPALIRSGVTYVPIRLLAEAFRVPVDWLPASHVVNLTVE